MKYYTGENVLEAAKKRIWFIIDEFEDIVVNVSWWKDSEVVFDLVKEVAREKWRLPIKVLWIDQEIERTSTYETVKRQMNDKDVIPYRYQIPVWEEIATNTSKRQEICRDPTREADWIRPKEKNSIKDNTWLVANRTDWIFESIFVRDFKDKKTAVFTWVRAEEAFARFLWVTNGITYKRITRGKKSTNNVYSFHPIYDWSFEDVRKYINEHNLEYNKMYDYYFRYGVSMRQMRVSSLFHETAYSSLTRLQEIDLNLYNKVIKRLDWVIALNQSWDTFAVRTPSFFKDDVDYLNYLLVAMWCDSKFKKDLINQLTRLDNLLIERNASDELYNEKMKTAIKTAIKSVLVNDTCLTKLKNIVKTMWWSPALWINREMK